MGENSPTKSVMSRLDPNYDPNYVRRWLRIHGIKAVIPLRSNQIDTSPATHRAFNRQAYRERNVIERCGGWLKECRRIATRFEKLAVNYLTFVQIAMIERLLRIGLSDRA